MEPIKIPRYDIIAPSLNNNSFIGWQYKVKIYEDIYLLIQYVNIPLPCLDERCSLQLPKTTPIWHFSFCAEDETPITSHRFQCVKGQEELGYQAGIDWALKESKKVGKAFDSIEKYMKLIY